MSLTAERVLKYVVRHFKMRPNRLFLGSREKGSKLGFMEKNSENKSTTSAIQKRVEQAHKLFGTCGRSLIEDPSISALLQKLRDCIDHTNHSMLTLGVVAECKNCEEKEGGSCCGSGIENKYDVVLLLINLLLGGSLQNHEPVDNSCFFLGKKGCKLTARHVLCVNYICDKLQKKLTMEELIALQTCAGEELNTLFFLHEAIKKHIRT
jgi:hypothetical protein